MSDEGIKPPNTRLRVREGYQPANSERRGYQVGLDKGYQPKAEISSNLQPPHVGSAAVVPQQNSNGNQTSGKANGKE